MILAALLGCTQAVQMTQRHDGDVFGPNGEGYTNFNANYDLSRIGIDIEKAGEGDKCKTGDWATVHYTASLEDGTEVSDTRAEAGGRPLHFTLGDHQAFKCFDVAIPQLKQGAKDTLHCPSFYAWGSAHTQSPLGGEPIPANSDIDFEIEVVECNREPTREPPESIGTQYFNRYGVLYIDETGLMGYGRLD